jgi:hypothetical protein
MVWKRVSGVLPLEKHHAQTLHRAGVYGYVWCESMTLDEAGLETPVISQTKDPLLEIDRVSAVPAPSQYTVEQRSACAV